MLMIKGLTIDGRMSLNDMLRLPEMDAFINHDYDFSRDIYYVKKIGNAASHGVDVGFEWRDDVMPKYALLGTHVGRRTFICNALALGIPPQVVMKWTGHSDYKAMKPYIDIADNIKANAMSEFNQL